MASNQTSIFVATQEGDVKEYGVKTGILQNTLSGHDNCVCALLLFENFIFTAGRDMVIHKWDILTGEIVQTLSGHVPYAVASFSYGEYLFTSGCSGSIIQFRASDGIKISTFEGHSSDIIEIKVFDNIMYSTSLDKTLIKWDMSGELVLVFEHPALIRSFTVIKNVLYTLCDEELIRQWDTITGVQTRIFGGDGPMKVSLFGCGNKLFSTNCDSTVSAYDSITGNVSNSLYPETSTAMDRSVHIAKSLNRQSDISSLVPYNTPKTKDIKIEVAVFEDEDNDRIIQRYFDLWSI